jgi:hypothetical protein
MGQASTQMGQALWEKEGAVSVFCSLRTAHQQGGLFYKMMRGGVESRRVSATVDYGLCMPGWPVGRIQQACPRKFMGNSRLVMLAKPFKQERKGRQIWYGSC